MAYTNFKQEVWTAGVLRQIGKQRVAASLVNSSYSNTIKRKGDTVHIRGVDALSAAADAHNFTYSDASPSILTFSVDQDTVVPFRVPEEDAATTDLNIVDIYTTEAGRIMAEEADAYVLGLINTTAFDATAVSLDLTGTPDVYASLISLQKQLNKVNAPRTGRYVIVNAEVEAQLYQSSNFLRATSMGDAVVANGFLGKALGFEVFSSENFAKDTAAGEVDKLFAGVRGYIGYADIVFPVRALELQGDRSLGVDAYHLYGAKIIRPEFFVRWDVTVA